MNAKRWTILTMTAICMVLAAGKDGFSVVARKDAPDADLVTLGEGFPAAGRVIPDGGCTLIAPTWAITAAHVAHSIQAGKGRVTFRDREYVVKRVVTHPQGASSGHGPPRVDLALLELNGPVEGLAPARLYRGTDERGQTAYIVGYGDLGDGETQPRRSDGRRRAVTNLIDDAGPERIFMKFDRAPGGTDLEGVGGPGDSGGPAFVRRDGRVYLVGVSHASMGGKPGRYGTTDIYMRVSSYVDWIDQVAGTGRAPD